MIDIGANLTDRSFDGDRDAVLERAFAAGLTGILLTGTEAHVSEAAADLAAQHTGRLWSTAGVHPHHASDWDDATADHLRRLCALPQVVAVGETGLDFYRDRSPRPVQEQVFRAQLALAHELGMPAFLHERDAADTFTAVWRSLPHPAPAGVVHCFTGSADALDAYLELGLHVGITGWICDERRGLGLRDLVARIPDDRLLIETDAPYLIPRDLRPRPKTRRNEPQWLGQVRDAVARCRVQSPEHVAAITAANAQRLFRLR